MVELLNKNKEEIIEKLDQINKKLNDDQKIESRKEIEVKEDPSTLLSENNNNETNNEYVEMKTKKRHQRKLINTREEQMCIRDRY